MRRLIGLLALLAFTLGASRSSVTAKPTRRLLVADTVLASGHFHVEVEVEPIPTSFPWAKSMFGCGLDGASTYVRAIRLREGDKQIGVALSGYADLGNPSRAKFQAHAQGALLILEGNEGMVLGNPWTVQFVIENQFVVRRKIWLSASPAYGGEETKFDDPSD